MNEILALHTAARRYCMERRQLWWDRYAQLQKGREHRIPYTYTEDDLDTFPRYQALEAILSEVQQFSPTDFESVAEARELLTIAGETADSLFTSGGKGPIEQAAIASERARFTAYLATLRPVELSLVKPLPLERTLGSEEVTSLRTRLAEAWGVESYWYPLAETDRSDVEAFQEQHFLDEGVDSLVKHLLEARGVMRAFEVREWEPHLELEVSSLDVSYDGREGFWFNDAMDWLVYASHESSITIGGWLLADLQEAWPGWRERVWTSPFYD